MKIDSGGDDDYDDIDDSMHSNMMKYTPSISPQQQTSPNIQTSIYCVIIFLSINSNFINKLVSGFRRNVDESTPRNLVKKTTLATSSKLHATPMIYSGNAFKAIDKLTIHVFNIKFQVIKN